MGLINDDVLASPLMRENHAKTRDFHAFVVASDSVLGQRRVGIACRFAQQTATRSDETRSYDNPVRWRGAASRGRARILAGRLRSGVDASQPHSYCGAVKNITVSIEHGVCRAARVQAAKQDTSVSALVRNYLKAFARGQAPPLSRLRSEDLSDGQTYDGVRVVTPLRDLKWRGRGRFQRFRI